MTSQNSYTEPSRAPIAPLFLNTLRRKWTTMLLIAIIMFFVFPLPIIMIFSNSNGLYGDVSRITTIMHDWANGIRYVFVPLLSVLAVVMSCVSLRYLHNKVSSNFYHSLPIKRGRLLANQLLSGYVILIVPTLIMFVIALIAITAYGGMDSSIFASSLANLGEAMLYSFIFYGLSSLVGVVTGLTVVQLLLTAVAIFIVPATYSLIVWFISIFVENFWTDFYLNLDVASYLTPVIRFIANTDRLRFYEIIIYLVVAALLFFLTHIVYRKYRPERAGIPVIFSELGEVIKYLLVFMMTIAGGLLFYLLMNRAAWTIFGMICGGLLTFMLVNTILNKSAKAMFRGLPGLGIYAGVIAVAMIMTFSNILGWNTKIPVGNSKVGVIFDDNTDMMYFKEDDVKSALKKIYNEREESFYVGNQLMMNDDVLARYTWDSQAYSRLYLKVVYYPKFGLPVAKQFVLYNKNDFENELRTILDSKEFGKQYTEMLGKIDSPSGLMNRFTSLGYVMNITDGAVSYSGFDQSEMRKKENLISALKADAANVNFDYFQQMSFGNMYSRIRLSSDGLNPSYIYMPLTASAENTLNAMYMAGASNVSPEDYASRIADYVSEVSVLNYKTGESRVYTKKSEIKEIIMSLSSICSRAYESDFCQLTLLDTDYMVDYTLSIGSGDEAYDEVFSGAFLLGKVPEFVSRG